MVVFKVQTALSAGQNIIGDLVFMFRAKRPLDIRHSDIDETADKVGSDERGKTEELHTSGAKRAETWRGGVKRSELDIDFGGYVGG